MMKYAAAIAVLSLLASQIAYASEESEKRFTVTGGATYLEPSFSGLDLFAVANVPTTGTDIFSTDTESMVQDFNWGYFLGANYRISRHYDVQATWAQINARNTDNDGILGQNSTTLITSNKGAFGVSTGLTANVDAVESLDYKVFDATLGQYHEITDMLKTRLFAGLRYAKITTDTDIIYTIPGMLINPFDHYSASYSGVGPQAGMDLEFQVYKNIGVVSSLAAACLVGPQSSNSDVYDDIKPKGQATVSAHNNTRLIPAVNAKLGANWDIPYRLHEWGFGIEAGYQLVYYFNVVDQLQYSSQPGLEVTHNDANLGFMGPYLNVSLAF